MVTHKGKGTVTRLCLPGWPGWQGRQAGRQAGQAGWAGRLAATDTIIAEDIDIVISCAALKVHHYTSV